MKLARDARQLEADIVHYVPSAESRRSCCLPREPKASAIKARVKGGLLSALVTYTIFRLAVRELIVPFTVSKYKTFRLAVREVQLPARRDEK